MPLWEGVVRCRREGPQEGQAYAIHDEEEDWVAVSNIFYLHPYWGEDSQFDEHIFQMGWFNHQLEDDDEDACQHHIKGQQGDDDFIEKVEDDEYVDHWKPISKITNSIFCS